MSAMKAGIGILLMASIAVPIEAGSLPQSNTPTTASAEVMQCAQAQMVVDQLLAAATARMEAARQANTAADLRAAVDSLQGTVRDARAQLAPCATMQPSAGAAMDHSKMPMGATPTAKPAPGAMPAMSPAMDHSKMPMGATPTAKPAPGGKPPAAAPMDHSKMPMGATPAAKPAPGAKPPAAAPMDHSKMPMGAAPAAKPAPSAAPPPAAPMDHSKMPMGGAPDDKTRATDPVCGLKVDPATAPKTALGGQTHYFCSEQHRELFQKNPTKYLPKGR